MTFYGHVRFAGSLVVLLWFIFHQPILFAFGMMLIAIGTVSGLRVLEDRVKELEDKNGK